MLILLQTFTSNPNPPCAAKLLFEPPGFFPPYTSVLLSLKCAKPTPRLTHGDTAVVGNKFTRPPGVKKKALSPGGTTANPYAPPFTSMSGLYMNGTSAAIE